MNSSVTSQRKLVVFLCCLSFLLLILALLVSLNRAEIFLPYWRQKPLVGINHEEGYAYITYIQTPELYSLKKLTLVQVWEDDNLLNGPVGARKYQIRNSGSGSFLVLKDSVYFSTPDNSDPRTNERNYKISFPVVLDAQTSSRVYYFTAFGMMLIISFLVFDEKSRQFIDQVKSGWVIRLLATYKMMALKFSNMSQKQWRGVFIVISSGTALLFLFSLLTFLNRSMIFLPYWRTEVLLNIQPDVNYAYYAPTHHPNLSSHESPSRAIVLEDEIPLVGPANALHDDIRNNGRGNYSFWFDIVYFSTSDNSDPVSNGRTYSIRYPVIVADSVSGVLYFTSILSFGFLILLSYKNQSLVQVKAIKNIIMGVEGFILTPPFYVGVVVFLLVFAISRLPFFLYYPVVGIQPDTQTYAGIANLMNIDKLPVFTMRTPGYPLFIWVIAKLADNWLFIILIQNLLTLSASISLIYGVYRLRRSLFLVSTLTLMGFLGSSQVLIYDTAALSESLFTSSLIFSFAFLLLAFGARRPLYYALASGFMACVILVRPAGMYLLVIFVLVLGYLTWNRFDRNVIIKFFVPLPVILLAFCTYNYFTINLFTISPWGGANLAHATVLYWEPDPKLPGAVNAKLEDLPVVLEDRVGFTEQDRLVLSNSWNYKELNPIFIKGFNGVLFDYTFGEIFFDTPAGGFDPLKLPVINEISHIAIREHPDYYLKFVVSNCVQYFENIKYHFEFYPYLSRAADVLYLQKYYSVKGPVSYYSWVAKEYADAPPPDGVRIEGTDESARIALSDTKLKTIHLAWESFVNNIFHQLYWAWALLLIWVMSSIKLIYTKGRHLGVFILFIFTTTVVGACLVTSLVEPALERYAYPTQFIYYLSLTLFPLLWLNVNVNDLSN